jgi:hypothetical protein
VDIIRNILLFVDKPTLRSAFTVSIPFYTAAGPLLYRHVSLISTETVLKVINLTAPARITRGHAKKTMTPLPFLKHTIALTIGFHLDSALPCDWTNKLNAVLPLVKHIKILRLTKAPCCSRSPVCQKAMWKLAGTLRAIGICLEIHERDDKLSLYSSSGWDSPRRIAPDEIPPTVKTLSIVLQGSLRSYGTPLTKLLSHCLGLDKQFDRYDVLIRDISTVLSQRLHAYTSYPTIDPVTLFDRRLDWSSSWGSKRDVAANVATLIGSSTATWAFYHLGDFHSKESSAWPAEIVQGFVAEKATITEMLKGILDDKYKADEKNRPNVHLRTRADYMQETDRYDLSAPLEAMVEKLEMKTNEDHNGVAAMYGTWDM